MYKRKKRRSQSPKKVLFENLKFRHHEEEEEEEEMPHRVNESVPVTFGYLRVTSRPWTMMNLSIILRHYKSITFMVWEDD